MKITGLSAQVRDKNRINVLVDGKYRFSLDITQVADLGIRVGREFSDQELTDLENESQFGKTYARALEYMLMRPHSAKELRDYLYRKTRDTLVKDGRLRKGVSPLITTRVYERLEEKGYVDDTKFTEFWVENRRQRQGISKRKLVAELRTKGVDSDIIESVLEESDRSDDSELRKTIDRAARRYDDPQKLMAYLARQGFSYDAIKVAISDSTDENYDD